MGEILDTMLRFLDDDHWPYAHIKDETQASIRYQGVNGLWMVFLHAHEEHHELIIYSILADHAPEEDRLRVAEFVTRANYGLSVGNFELDLSDGEIRFKTSIDVEGSTLTPALVRQLLYINITTVDKYLPGVVFLLYHGYTPEDAVMLIENPEGLAAKYDIKVPPAAGEATPAKDGTEPQGDQEPPQGE
jgi:hypothetical protein